MDGVNLGVDGHIWLDRKLKLWMRLCGLRPPALIRADVASNQFAPVANQHGQFWPKLWKVAIEAVGNGGRDDGQARDETMRREGLDKDQVEEGGGPSMLRFA